jgi:hypothetical protein
MQMFFKVFFWQNRIANNSSRGTVLTQLKQGKYQLNKKCTEIALSLYFYYNFNISLRRK